MNPSTFPDNHTKVMMLLNKMSERKGKTFSEEWLKLLLDGNPTAVKQTFAMISEDFGRVFHLFDTGERAQINLGNLRQDKNDHKDMSLNSNSLLPSQRSLMRKPSLNGLLKDWTLTSPRLFSPVNMSLPCFLDGQRRLLPTMLNTGELMIYKQRSSIFLPFPCPPNPPPARTPWM